MRRETGWRIVLVRPRNPLNIGAAARALANFGFEDLVVVEPHEPVWREARSAVGAEEIVRSARAEDDLQKGIADCTVVLGTTSGSRRNLDRELISLSDLPRWLKKHRRRLKRAALLFGSEKTGLSNDCLSYCHALVRIPTTPVCPSMNLGQAVAVCCYELARAGAVGLRRGLRRKPPSGTGPERSGATSGRVPAAAFHLSEPAHVQSLQHVFERAERVLDQVGYLKPKSRAATLVKLRRLLLSLELTNHNVKILGGVLAQIEWKLKNLP
jgi:TrmH family RNA methyltransferase